MLYAKVRIIDHPDLTTGTELLIAQQGWGIDVLYPTHLAATFVRPENTALVRTYGSLAELDDAQQAPAPQKG